MQREVLIVVSGSYPRGSAATSRMQLVAATLSGGGVRARVIAFSSRDGNTTPWAEDSFGIFYRQVRLRRALRGGIGRALSVVGLPVFLDRTLREHRFDAVLVYGNSGAFTSGVVAACATARAPLIADTTESWGYHRGFAPLYLDSLAFRRLILPRLSGVIAISEHLRNRAVNLGKPCYLLPAISSPLAVVPQKPRTDDTFRLTYVGPMFERDLPDVLLSALKLALQRCRARLTIVGRPETFESGRQALKRIESDSLLAQNVDLKGWLSEEEYLHCLAESDAFILLRPDTNEARACFPSRLPEFLRAGRPVIISEVGDVSRYLEHRQSAWLVSPGRCTQETADAIERLAREPALAATIGTNGRAAFETFFDYRVHTDGLAEFVNHVCDSSGRSGIDAYRQSSRRCDIHR